MPENGRDLYRVIPPGLFGPLTAPGAVIYGRILLALFQEWQKHVQPLSRESVIYCISAALVQPEAMHLTQDAADESTRDDEPSSDGDSSGADHPLEQGAADEPREDEVQARAGAILRYLTRRGWLTIETGPDFSQVFLFPGYAARILNVLFELTRGASAAGQGLIFPIYDTLRSAIEHGEAESRLPQAHRQTAELLVELRELRDNIGGYLERTMGQMLPRDVLDQMLTQYRGEIQSRMLHELHTTEHVSRYRLAVVETLSRLEKTGQLEEAAQRLAERKEFPSVAAARERILEQAHEIRDQFLSLDALLETIDLRHSQFVDAAVRSIELHLMSQSTTSGQLNQSIEFLLDRSKATPHRFAQLTNELIQLYQLTWPAPESLAQPLHWSEPFAPEPEAEPPPSQAQVEEARREVMLQMQQKFTQERVEKTVRQLLNGREQANAAELGVTGPADLPLVILIREFGREGQLGYVVDEAEDAPWIEMEGVGFRDFRIRPAPKESA